VTNTYTITLHYIFTAINSLQASKMFNVYRILCLCYLLVTGLSICTNSVEITVNGTFTNMIYTFVAY